MTIVDGQWVPETDPGEHERYPNYRTLDDLADLTKSTEFDFVIVGGGGAGAVAAIEAVDHGASALILEKMATPGGSTLAAGGTIRLVSDLEGMAEHFFELAQGGTPRDVIDAFVAGLAEVPQWFADHGGELAERNEEGRGHGDPRLFPISRPGSSFPNFPSADALAPRALLRAARPNRRPGAALWDFLSERVAERAVPMVLGAQVVRLLQEGGARAVTGVEVEHPNGNVMVRARRAVILCSGGFAYDRELMTQYYGIELPTVCPVGCATGDGIRMAQDVGADLWHMNATAASIGYWPEELKAGFQMKMPDYGFVMVDQIARRYVWETALENHSAVHAMLSQDSVTGEFLRTPSYVIFDEVTRLSGTLAHLPHGENRNYPWSKDNSAEVERGWIKKAGTPRELAPLLGLPADDLEQVINSFNATAEGDATDQFGRPASEMRAIASPPFYGARVFPIIVNTQGGPRRNARGEIVRPDGRPIPGLYGAGELGSIWNRLYPGAGNVGECFVSARLAVRSALGKLEEAPIPIH